MAVFRTAPLAGLALMLVACADQSTTPMVPVTQLELNPRHALSPGDTMHLTAGVFGATGRLTDRSVSWSSSNPAVVAISDSGVATGVALGTAIIRAEAEGVADSFPLRVTAGFAELTSEGYFTCGRIPAGRVYCWGYNTYSVIGSSFSDTAAPVLNPALPALATVQAGRDHACGLTAGGEAFCWGSSLYGQLGPGGQIGSIPNTVGNDAPLRSITAGGQVTCGLDASGQVYCWGSCAYGTPTILCWGTNEDVPMPGSIRYTQVSAGTAFVCGLATTGQVYCWGEGLYGYAGSGLGSDTAVVVTLPGPARLVTAGASHACAVTVTDEAYCWGHNENGQLGHGSQGLVGPVGPVRGGHAWATLDAGDLQTCGVDRSGVAWCWGFVGFPAPSSYSATSPRFMNAEQPWVEVSAGRAGCGRTAGGGAYCWGPGYNGQLGSGERFTSPRPRRVIDP